MNRLDIRPRSGESGVAPGQIVENAMNGPARRLGVCALFFLGAALAADAVASPLDLYGLGSRTIGMGGAGTAAARDYSVLFYNPGRIGFVRPGLGVHFIATIDDVSITRRDRPAGYDVPEDVYRALPIDPSATKMTVRYLPTSETPPRRNTTDDPNYFGLTGGVTHNFGLRWFALGVAFSLPLLQLASADFHFVDEREQFFTNRLYFQLLNRRASRPAFLFGLGFRPLDWFGFGATVEVFGNIEADTRMFVPDALDQKNIHFLVAADVKYDAAATVGLQFEPVEWVGIGITFRDRSWFNASIDNRLQFWNFELYEGEPITVQKFRYAYSFSPRKLAGGLRFDIDQWTLSAEAAWLLWSEFNAEVDTGDDSSFRDVITARAGVEWRALNWLDVRLGGAWVPSPVGRQDGRTNYVDNDRVEATTGFSFYLPWVEDLSIDVHAQFLVLLARDQGKSKNSDIVDEFPDARDIKTDQPLESSLGLQTNNPGWPGYHSEGFITSLGLGVTYRF